MDKYVVKEVTLRRILNAFRKNGLTQIKHSYLEYDSNEHVWAGCAIGQAAFNLGVDPDSLHNVLNRVHFNYNYPFLNITTYNDNEGKTIDEITDILEANTKIVGIPLNTKVHIGYMRNWKSRYKNA